MATQTPSPFDFSGPSLASRDRKYRVTSTGLTHSEVASQAVKTRTARTGTHPGTIPGLSKKADLQRKPIGEVQAMVRRAR